MIINVNNSLSEKSHCFYKLKNLLTFWPISETSLNNLGKVCGFKIFLVLLHRI
nr:MAG TPA: hypothetical protein [Bacteriophage sp.]